MKSIIKKSKKKWIRYTEGPDFIEKIRLYFSTKLLDFAERIPEVKSGYFHQLQYIRKKQREVSKKNYSLYQIPQETRIELLGFQLMELIHIEDLESFKRSLQRLFPENQRFSEDFDNFHQGLSPGEFQNQGFLVRAGDKRLFNPLRTCEVSGLSEKVDHINIFSHQITPSLYAFTSYVLLAKEFRSEFRKFFETSYLYPTKIGKYHKKIDFLPNTGFGYHQFGAEEEFWIWSDSLQHEVEELIQNIFIGYFADQNNSLPRIDIFLQNEEPRIGIVENGEKDKKEYWKSCIGLESFNKYEDSNKGIQWITYLKDYDKNWLTRIIVNPKIFLSDQKKSYSNNTDTTIWNNLKYQLVETPLPLSFLTLFKAEKDRINLLRKKVFQTQIIQIQINSNKLIDLLEKVQSSYIKLFRILTEFNMDDSLLNHQANQLGNTYISTLNKERNLGEDLKNNLNQSSKSLKTYNDFIQNITGQIMYIVNLKTNKKIAITSLIIAIITMIITVFTLEINLSNFIDFLKNLDF